jgi:hypothetical protein
MKKKNKKKKHKKKIATSTEKPVVTTIDSTKAASTSKAASTTSMVSMLSFLQPLSTGYNNDKSASTTKSYRGWTSTNDQTGIRTHSIKQLTRLEQMAKDEAREEEKEHS